MENLTTDQKKRASKIYEEHSYKKLEQRVNVLAEYIDKHLLPLINKLYREVETLKSQQQTPNPDGGIFKVKSIFFNKEYEYKDKTFSRYIVELEGFPNPFIMDRKAKNIINPEVGGNIFCKIDGDKLRDVEVIHTVSN